MAYKKLDTGPEGDWLGALLENALDFAKEKQSNERWEKGYNLQVQDKIDRDKEREQDEYDMHYLEHSKYMEAGQWDPADASLALLGNYSAKDLDVPEGYASIRDDHDIRKNKYIKENMHLQNFIQGTDQDQIEEASILLDSIPVLEPSIAKRYDEFLVTTRFKTSPQYDIIRDDKKNMSARTYFSNVAIWKTPQSLAIANPSAWKTMRETSSNELMMLAGDDESKMPSQSDIDEYMRKQMMPIYQRNYQEWVNQGYNLQNAYENSSDNQKLRITKSANDVANMELETKGLTLTDNEKKVYLNNEIEKLLGPEYTKDVKGGKLFVKTQFKGTTSSLITAREELSVLEEKLKGVFKKRRKDKIEEVKNEIKSKKEEIRNILTERKELLNIEYNVE